VLGLDPYSKPYVVACTAGHLQAGCGRQRGCRSEPTDDPSLSDDQAEFNKLNTNCLAMERAYIGWAKVRVYAGQNLGDVFSTLKVPPDFETTKPKSDTRLLFVHRKAYGTAISTLSITATTGTRWWMQVSA